MPNLAILFKFTRFKIFWAILSLALLGTGGTLYYLIPMPQPTVRIIYAVPTDREVHAPYPSAIKTAIHHVQRWYAERLDCYTFALEGPIPQVCMLRNASEYYERAGGWDRILADLQECAPVAHGSRHYVWVVYPDVRFDCELSELGAGGDGVTILHRGDLDGLVSPKAYELCGYPPRGAYGWIGGLAHELGHAFGLEHPPGCEEELSSCDYDTLMWAGYLDYPDTYLTTPDRITLRASPFFTHRVTY